MQSRLAIPESDGHPRGGQMLRHPESGAAARSVTAQLPAWNQPRHGLFLRRGGMPSRLSTDMPRKVTATFETTATRRQAVEGRSRGRERAGRPEADRAHHRAHRVPGLAAQRGVGDRGPGELPHVRDVARRDERRDLLHRHARLRQEEADGYLQVAAQRTEWQDEEQKDDRVDVSLGHEARRVADRESISCAR